MSVYGWSPPTNSPVCPMHGLLSLSMQSAASKLTPTSWLHDSCEKCKAMFCCTETGRGAIVRQLEPAVHLDTSPTVLQYLAPHIARVVYIDSSRQRRFEVTRGSLLTVSCMSEFVSQYPARAI